VSNETTRFEEALDRWGSNFSNWPRGAADWGRRRLETSAEARRAHEQAQLLEEALGALPPLAASDDLKRRIATAAGTRRDGPTPGRLWRPALAAAIPLLVGFWLGLNQGQSDATTSAEEIGLIAFTTNPEELDYGP
jgi:hypothetical protein